MLGKKKYLTSDSAKEIQKKAMTDSVPEKKKERIIAKIPRIKDENKLFYYACSGDPEIQKAAISHIKSPLNKRILTEIFWKDLEILKICVDNPNINEKELLEICKKLSDVDLRQYIITQKFQSEASLIECIKYTNDSYDLQCCALARLNKLENMTSVLQNAYGKIYDDTVERIQQEWPTQADQAFENMVLYFARKMEWVKAAELNRKISKHGKAFDKSVLNLIRADKYLKNYEKNSKAATELIGDIHDEKLLFDFASNYDVTSLVRADVRGDVTIIKAAVKKLTDEHLLAIINDHDSEHHEKRQAAVPYLSPESLMAVAMNDHKLKYEAAEELSEEEKNAFVKDASYSKELRVAMVKHIKDDAALVDILLSCDPYNDPFLTEAAKAISDPDVLADAAEKLGEHQYSAIYSILIEKCAKYKPEFILKDKRAPVTKMEEALDSISDENTLRSVYEDSQYPESVRFKAVMKLRDQELIAEYVLHSRDESLRKLALSVITDPELLRKIASECTNIHIRWCAAWRAGDDEMLKEIESGRKRVNGHVVFVTINDPWVEYQERCMRCGEVYGRTDDSETTRHYGELFTRFSCTPAVERLDAIRLKD